VLAKRHLYSIWGLGPKNEVEVGKKWMEDGGKKRSRVRSRWSRSEDEPMEDEQP